MGGDLLKFIDIDLPFLLFVGDTSAGSWPLSQLQIPEVAKPPQVQPPVQRLVGAFDGEANWANGGTKPLKPEQQL